MASTLMKRLSASIPDKLYARLERLAAHEGRSVSNLVGYLLESSIDMKLLTYDRAKEDAPVNRSPKAQGGIDA